MPSRSQAASVGFLDRVCLGRQIDVPIAWLDASRLYLTAPWIVIGVGALFFPKPRKDEEVTSEAA